MSNSAIRKHKWSIVFLALACPPIALIWVLFSNK